MTRQSTRDTARRTAHTTAHEAAARLLGVPAAVHRGLVLDGEPPPPPRESLQWEAVQVRLSGGNRLYSSVIRAGAAVEAQYGTDEDEGWWPGTVLTAHTEGFHAGSFDVLYADGEGEFFKPAKRVRLDDTQRS